MDGSPHEIPGIPVRAPGRWWEDGGLSLLQSALQALALLTQPPPHSGWGGGGQARCQEQGSPTPEPWTGTSLQPVRSPAAQQEVGNASFLSVYGHPQCTWASQAALTVKNLPANAGEVGDEGSISGSGRSPGEGHGNPLQYSYLENPMDRGAWGATVHWVTKSST